MTSTLVIRTAPCPRAWTSRGQWTLQLDGRGDLRLHTHPADAGELLAASGDVTAARWRSPGVKTGRMRAQFPLTPRRRSAELILTRADGREFVLPLDAWWNGGTLATDVSELQDITEASGFRELVDRLGLDPGFPSVQPTPDVAPGRGRRLDPLAAPRSLRAVSIGYIVAIPIAALVALAAELVTVKASSALAYVLAVGVVAPLPLAWLLATCVFLNGRRRLHQPVPGQLLSAGGSGPGRLGLDELGDVVAIDDAGFEVHLRGPASGRLTVSAREQSDVGLRRLDLSWVGKRRTVSCLQLSTQHWQLQDADVVRARNALEAAGVAWQQVKIPRSAPISAPVAARGSLSPWPGVIMLPGQLLVLAFACLVLLGVENGGAGYVLAAASGLATAVQAGILLADRRDRRRHHPMAGA